MIISDEFQLAFVHIPKCAGSTIVVQLDQHNSFRHDRRTPFQHPRRGPISAYHLPLDVLAEFFPEQFEKICSYDSYATIRDPRRRFISAFLNYMREFRRIEIARHSPARLRQEAHDVCTRLQSGDGRSYEFMHFQKQCSFVELNGRRIIRNLYAVEDLRRLADDMNARHGLRITGDIAINKARLPANPVFRAIGNVIRPGFRKIPSVAMQEILRRLFHIVASGSTRFVYQELEADRSLMAFVDDYYAEDVRLHRSVLCSRDQVDELRLQWDSVTF